MNRQQVRMLREIQELEFAALEMNLYLDTHPEDETALSTFNSLVSRLAGARRAYEAEYGPLINFGHSSPSRLPWQWIEEPWPWDIEY
ncbi:MAG: spore coat protein CotJB [Firmicutes bacterium]|nr:spore coat protein CotJB [Bacillota bacterium]